MTKRKRQYKSRLARVERKKNLRRAIFFLSLTAGLLTLLVTVGVPLLIKAAVFWGNWQETQSLPVEGDQRAPAPPRLAYLPLATNSAQLLVKGFTEEGVKVKVWMDEQVVKEVIAGSKGEFLASGINLKKGTNTIWVTAEDQSGNLSLPSKKVAVRLDDQPPSLEIEFPGEGQEFHGEKEKKMEIKGKTEKGANLTINNRWVIVDKEGLFSHFLQLEEGENVLMVKARDEAGNVTEKELKVRFEP